MTKNEGKTPKKEAEVFLVELNGPRREIRICVGSIGCLGRIERPPPVIGIRVTFEKKLTDRNERPRDAQKADFRSSERKQKS